MARTMEGRQSERGTAKREKQCHQRRALVQARHADGAVFREEVVAPHAECPPDPRVLHVLDERLGESCR
eukprot:227054-Pyramimonas_sp.AAC.1